MSAWTRLRHFLGNRPPTGSGRNTTITSKENALTAPGTTDQRITELRAQLEDIATESAADPAAVADNLQAWRNRESTRQDRVVAIEQQIRQLGEFGALVGTPAMDAIRTYAATTADARAKLERVAAERVFGFKADGTPRARVPQAPKLMEQWLQALTTLANALPATDPHASAYLCQEYGRWFQARNGWLQAIAVEDDGARWVPWPEIDGGLPTGFAYGVHRRETTDA